MVNSIKSVYASYHGDGSYHFVRLILQLMIGCTIGLFGDQVIEKSFSVMSLAISVLTGFSFTALFSEPSVRMVDLPSAADETDREHLRRLRTLSLNFRVRIRLFIALAVLQLILMVAVSINVHISGEVYDRAVSLAPALNKAFHYGTEIKNSAFRFSIGIIYFLFLEWIYTFYRTSETILAILQTRSDYLEAHARIDE